MQYFGALVCLFGSIVMAVNGNIADAFLLLSMAIVITAYTFLISMCEKRIETTKDYNTNILLLLKKETDEHEKLRKEYAALKDSAEKEKRRVMAALEEFKIGFIRERKRREFLEQELKNVQIPEREKQEEPTEAQANTQAEAQTETMETQTKANTEAQAGTEPTETKTEPTSKAKTKKCNRCGKVADISEFVKNMHSKDGHRNTCKQCNREMQKKSRKNIKYIERAEKTCPKCGRLLPIEKFGTDATKKDGHRSWCMECTAKHRAEIRKQHAKAKANTREIKENSRPKIVTNSKENGKAKGKRNKKA